MTTKSLSRKHVIIPISNNKMKFMADSSVYITNINKVLKNIKLKVMTNFIHSDQAGITIIINKVALLFNFQTIEKYIKKVNYIEANKVKVSCLLQSKSYLKIMDISYLVENTNIPIIVDVVKIASRPCIIKVFSKFNMAMI